MNYRARNIASYVIAATIGVLAALPPFAAIFIVGSSWLLLLVIPTALVFIIAFDGAVSRPIARRLAVWVVSSEDYPWEDK